ncbi:MAG: AAA family ATPase [Bacillota bacterium]|nr:AAA family ATPase [Bacillota bacterium]
MYVFGVRVRGFRSLEDMWVFPSPGVNVLVGPNNSGKTSLLRAMDLILNPLILWNRDDTITRFDYLRGDVSRHIGIQVWLKPHEQENDDLKAKLFDKLTLWQVQLSDDHPVGINPVTVEPFADPPPNHERLLAVRFTAEWDDEAQTAIVQHSICDEMGNVIVPLSTEIKRLLDFRYYSTRKNPLEQLSLARRSLLSRTLTDNSLNSIFHGLLNTLEGARTTLLENPQVDKLLQRLNTLVAPELLGHGTSQGLGTFTLTFLNSETWRLRNATSLALRFPVDQGTDTDKGLASLPLEYQGEGVQNLLLLLSIIELVAKPGTHCIVALEEPEQNLEPALAEWVFTELCSRSSVSDSQLFVTTHSPALVGSLGGADQLLMVPVSNTSERRSTVLSARYLPVATKKSFERERERYSAALLARCALVVEGPSELGFLPVAFRQLASNRPSENPFHLGLQIVNGEDREKAVKHARALCAFRRRCIVLLDHDRPGKTTDKTTAELMEMGRQAGAIVLCWSNRDLLPFTPGCDLEVVLVSQVPPAALFAAIQEAYEDCGHELKDERWISAVNKVNESMRAQLPERFPGNLGDFDLDSLHDVVTQRAFLYVLLHGPHECKSTRDMRIIAEHLAARNVFPKAVDQLRRRVLGIMTGAEWTNNECPHIVAP